MPTDGKMKRPGVDCGVDDGSPIAIFLRFGDGDKLDARYGPFSGSGIESCDTGCVKGVKLRSLLSLSSISSSSSDIDIGSLTLSRWFPSVKLVLMVAD